MSKVILQFLGVFLIIWVWMGYGEKSEQIDTVIGSQSEYLNKKMELLKNVTKLELEKGKKITELLEAQVEQGRLQVEKLKKFEDMRQALVYSPAYAMSKLASVPMLGSVISYNHWEAQKCENSIDRLLNMSQRDAELDRIIKSSDVHIEILRQELRRIDLYLEIAKNEQNEFLEKNKEMGEGLPTTFSGRMMLALDLLMIGMSLCWGKAFFYTLGLYALSVLWKLLNYYVIAPSIELTEGVSLSNGAAPQLVHEKNEALHKSHKLISLKINPGEAMIVRSEEYTGGYTDDGGERLSKRTEWFVGKRYIMSIKCGLFIMTRFKNASSNTRAHELHITSTDPDEYFSCIDIPAGQRLYITPSDLIAYSEGMEVRSTWKLSSWAAWSMGQVRYYTISGPGRVVVRADGGITRTALNGYASAVRKRHSVICATEGVQMHVRRTETLMPYLLGKSDLYDLRLYGKGVFHMRNARAQSHTLIDRTYHVFMEGIGKLLGF